MLLPEPDEDHSTLPDAGGNHRRFSGQGGFADEPAALKQVAIGKTRLSYSWDPPLTSANATSHPFRMPASYSLCSGVERIKKLRIWHSSGSAADDIACCSADRADPQQQRPAGEDEPRNERRAAGGFTGDARTGCGIQAVDEVA